VFVKTLVFRYMRGMRILPLARSFALTQVLLVAAGAALGDEVIVQEVDGMAQNGQMTIMVGPEKVRTDISPQMSTITDVATGSVTSLMHAEKAYIVISAAATKALVAAATAQPGQTAPPASPAASPEDTSLSSLASMHSPALHSTGKTQKINGYSAEEYTFTNGNMKATYWLTKNFPNAGMVIDALAKMKKGGLASIASGFTPDITPQMGVPLKTEFEMNGQKISTILLSATEQAVDPAEYQVPGGYTEMKMPGTDMPGGDVIP